MSRPRTVVVTGGSAGIGRAAAIAFARRGWNVGLIARSEDGLAAARKDVETIGGRALTVAADVADSDAVFAAARRFVEAWGAIDVWVNNAMVTMLAPVAESSPAEVRRITEVTYLGSVHGTMAALLHMRERNAGTIVQVGSALSYRAIPLQSSYCAAKFALRGFTDALRCELLQENSAIRLVMVQLPAVNTPQFDWARNKLERRPQPLPPIFQPEAAAAAIYRASHDGAREAWVGSSSMKAILGTMIAPALLDRLLATKGYEGQLATEPERQGRADNLFEPVSGLHAVHGRFEREAATQVVSFHPPLVRLAVAMTVMGALVGATALVL